MDVYGNKRRAPALPKGRIKPRGASPLIWREDLPNLTLFSTRDVERRSRLYSSPKTFPPSTMLDVGDRFFWRRRSSFSVRSVVNDHNAKQPTTKKRDIAAATDLSGGCRLWAT